MQGGQMSEVSTWSYTFECAVNRGDALPNHLHVPCLSIPGSAWNGGFYT